jgi:transcriptional repressor NrdR
VAPPRLRVVKADGRREEFQREKLLAGVLKACAKRPIPTEVIEGLVGEIEGELYRRGEREVESRVIGEMVMERLRELDDVAYVRFASVYRRFADVGSLAEEIENLLERKRKEEEMRRQLRLEL